MLWESKRLPLGGHTCRAHNSGRGCHIVPFAWEEDSLFLDMRCLQWAQIEPTQEGRSPACRVASRWGRPGYLCMTPQTCCLSVLAHVCPAGRIDRPGTLLAFLGSWCACPTPSLTKDRRSVCPRTTLPNPCWKRLSWQPSFCAPCVRSRPASVSPMGQGWNTGMSHLFCRHSHKTRSCRSQRRDADNVEWRGRANALSLCSDDEAHGHWADVSSLVTGRSNPLSAVFFSSQIPGRKKMAGCEGRSRSLKRKLTASAERQDWNSCSASIQHSAFRFPQAWHTLSVSVISVQGIPARLTMMARHLQQRCADICSSRSYRIAAGDGRICKLVAARGPIQLLRRFNGRSRCQRRVSKEGSLSLKRRNCRCGGKAYIARRPSHFGRLWRAA